ncbi:hypothetical protein, conserved, DUF89 family [Thermococcus onnurineus NA1]|uniref:Damage-control phosphatase ARMT1-like metal-binding domain-containing protein n=1 Tax=Thermococcus onnurineus (strain NA1) TaxID=523850 RepID=B6YSS3_THEON|nr:damage-control phosphatase [Thermococcus onnurineus]ACJ15610.1 hypothetical protein, conserved, DUF89 family [Thermococcus onnurineus NA1]
MKIHYECIACAVNQAQKIVEMSTPDLKKRREAMVFFGRRIGEFFEESSVPATDGGRLFLELYSFLGDDDPFRDYKRRSTELAAKVATDIGDVEDFGRALKLAIAGNVIDFAVGYDPEKIGEDILRMTEEELYVDESNELFEELGRAKSLLYLLDNCGEIYFDKLFLELIRKLFPGLTIYVAAKEGPIINDATVEDLREAGFEELANVVSTGSCLPGAPMEYVSKEFKEIFRKVDVVIAKGQANFETLSDLKDSRIFFLLKAKCRPISRELNVPQGSLVCIRGA